MGNHFHLLVFQKNSPDEISRFMKSVATAYSMYYNLRYKNKGCVFQGVFRASRIAQEPYLAHISRYIHLNPETYQTYKWSSLKYYLGVPQPAWLRCSRVLDMSPTAYQTFLEDYKNRRQLLKQIKDQLSI